MAQYNLGEMYYFGNGAPKDAVQAYAWYKIALANGDEGAKKWRDELELTPEQLAEANEAIKAQAPNTSLASDGELKDLFTMGSDNTDLQREEKEKAIKGEVVQWTLPVYEVNKLEEGKFKIQTSGMGHVATFCYIVADGDDDIAKLSALKTGDMVTVKGKIEGIFMRSIRLDPCFLVSSD